MKIDLVIFLYSPYRNVLDNGDSAHQCIMFNGTNALYLLNVIFIIKYGGAFEH
jgi:hypothetical protein